MLDEGVTRQVCSLRVPITPSPSSHHHTVTLGYLNIVLILENAGPIKPESKKPVSEASAVKEVGVTQEVGMVPEVGVVHIEEGGLVGSLEYKTAVELELWKVSQQEAFEVNMTKIDFFY